MRTINETPELKLANDSPWYLLATIYGEDDVGYSEKLREKNRVAWNRWMAGELTDDQRNCLVAIGFSNDELDPFTDADKLLLLEAYETRAGRHGAVPPASSEVADLQYVRFSSSVHFKCYIFPNGATFSHAVFERESYFGRSMFLAVTDFGETEFKRNVDFSCALFTIYTDFVSAKFHCGSDFTGTRFDSSTTFHDAIFSWGAVFSGAYFGDYVDFLDVHFLQTALFDHAKFCDGVRFNGSECRFQIRLDHAEFKRQVPEFFSAKLPESIEFQYAKWPSVPDDYETAQNHLYSYQRLKSEMERLKRHEDEQFFFTKELRAKRALLRQRMFSEGRSLRDRLTDLGELCISTAYGLLSNYGRSIGKPVFFLTLLFALGTVTLSLIDALTIGPLAWPDAAELSVANLLSFLPYKPSKILLDSLTPTAKVIGNIQSILGPILLFLLGLALRNRFRVK